MGSKPPKPPKPPKPSPNEGVPMSLVSQANMKGQYKDREGNLINISKHSFSHEGVTYFILVNGTSNAVLST